MRARATAWLLACLLLLLAASAAPVEAREEILLFRSAVEVEADGALEVEETITVRAEGNAIRRGIYRDFPIRYPAGSGLDRYVGFDLLDVRRDGRPEPHHTERIGDHVRIYAGEASTFLRPGEYTYTFRYRTTRQIRHFADYDELYWNVVGDQWGVSLFDIDVDVQVPGGIDKAACYAGETGSRAT